MDEDYPKTLLEMEHRFATEDACREYLTKLRWPTGFVCPACQGKGGSTTPLDMPRLSAPVHGDRRHYSRGNSPAATSLVSCGVAAYEPEVRCQCVGRTARSGSGQLRNGLELASQTAPGHGATGKGSSQGHRRSRRSFRGWGECGHWARWNRENAGCHRSRRRRQGYRSNPLGTSARRLEPQLAWVYPTIGRLWKHASHGRLGSISGP